MPEGRLARAFRRLLGPAAPEGPCDEQALRRFVTAGDESAFAEIVRRHGPRVLGLCRRILHHEQDAEDCFQATFLVLARKAGSVRHGAALAGWLYQVAVRIARAARAQAARRRELERSAPAPAQAPPGQ